MSWQTEFTERQRKTVASGLTALALATLLAFAGVVAWAFFKILSAVSPAIVPVIVGFLLSLFFKPYYRWWLKLLRNPAVALAAMLLSVLIPLGLVLWCMGSAVSSQVVDLVRQMPELSNRVTAWARDTFPGLRSLLASFGMDIGDITMGIGAAYGGVAAKVGFGAVKTLGFILSTLVTLVFFAFFITSRERKGSEIVAQLAFLKKETRDFVARQIDAFVDIIVSFFQRQTVICLVEGVIYGTGFALVGLPSGFLIGFALGVVNIVPLLGSIVFLPIAMSMAYFAHDGSCARLVLTICVWAAGQFLDGYLITPRIQGGRTGLGYAGVVFSFFFWGILLGPVLGLLLAIPLSAFCVVLWRAVKARYIRPVV